MVKDGRDTGRSIQVRVVGRKGKEWNMLSEKTFDEPDCNASGRQSLIIKWCLG